MTRRKGTHSSQGVQKGGSRQLAVLLPVLAAVIVGAAFYHFYLRREPERPPPPPPSQGAQADVIRAKIENALVDFDETAHLSSPGAQELRRRVLTTWRDAAAKYILTDPGDVLVRPALAKLLLKLDQVNDAERVVDDLLKLSPDSAEGLWLKGLVLRARRQAGFLELFRRAAESPQAHSEILATYGKELFAAGRFDQAEVYLNRALDAKRKEAGQLSKGDAQLLYFLGVISMSDSRFPQAADRLAEAAALADDDLEIVLKLIQSQRRSDRLDAAAETVADARRRFPKWADQAALSMELGAILQARQRWPEAAEAYAAAAKHPRLGTEASFEAAKCYYQAGRYALAMPHMDAVAAARANDAEVQEWSRRIEDARFPRAGDQPDR